MADNLNMHLNICTLFIPQCTAVMASRHAEKKQQLLSLKRCKESALHTGLSLRCACEWAIYP